MADEPTRSSRVTNEVLEERVSNYFSRLMDELRGIRQDMEKQALRFERIEAEYDLLRDNQRDHEHLPGHPDSMLRLSDLTIRVTSSAKDIEKLSQLTILGQSVSSMQVELSKHLNQHREESTREEAKRTVWGQIWESSQQALRLLTSGAAVAAIAWLLKQVGII